MQVDKPVKGANESTNEMAYEMATGIANIAAQMTCK